MFEENLLIRIMALLCLVLVVGPGSAMATTPLIEYKPSPSGIAYYPYYGYGESDFLLGGLCGMIIAGSAIFLWSTVGPGRKIGPMDKKLSYARAAANAAIAAIGFSIAGAMVIAGTMGMFPHISESGFLKLMVLVGLAVPIGVFLHLRNSLSWKEAAITSALEFGFSLILFPLCLVLMLALSNFFFPPPVYYL